MPEEKETARLDDQSTRITPRSIDVTLGPRLGSVRMFFQTAPLIHASIAHLAAENRRPRGS